MPDDRRINVIVVFADVERSSLAELSLPPGSTLNNAIERSRILEHVNSESLATLRFGVFGRERPRDYLLNDGDQVEVYRPLAMDAKARRRERARRKSHSSPVRAASKRRPGR